ncbi:MAG: helix-hairpin-helix domain-containing protein [Verrucomicrobia bacterium]|nr:helix-hairpin-helix domain-containing protein [Deltaproteobacteria bacterium]
MKNSITRIALTAATVLLATGIAFAIDVKTPDIKGAAKATADKSKADAKADTDKIKTDAKGAADKTKVDAKARIIDINSASEAELKAIPGIGDAYAAKIIASRPYANKAQLKSRNILPVPAYEKTKDLIIAKKPKK